MWYGRYPTAVGVVYHATAVAGLPLIKLSGLRQHQRLLITAH
jgi:hypothetical protein